jgi:UDP-N-acetylmuramate dehydrogenase
VSTQHANFIVNTGRATAQDVLALIEQIQAAIQQQFGIDLMPEVLVVGDIDTKLSSQN